MPAPLHRPRPLAWALLVVATVGCLALTEGEREQHRLALAREMEGVEETPPATNRLTPIWPSWVLRGGTAVDHGASVLQVGLLVGGAGLCALTVPPRPWRRATGKPRPRPGPGRIASAIAAVILALTLVIEARSIWLDSYLAGLPLGADPDALGEFWGVLSSQAGGWMPATIVAAWMSLAAGGQRWRRPEGQVERLGRWVGWAWIATGLSLKLLALLGMTAPNF